MSFIRLTLEDGRPVLVRTDLIEQIRQRPEGGAELWLPTATVTVSESVDEIQRLIEGDGK